MKANLHTHTARCGHASGSDEEFVRAALEEHFEVLGFSDHAPWPYRSGFEHPGVRMNVRELPGYVRSVRSLRDKYGDKIRILLGLECEYFPEYISWLEDTAQEYAMDYLILGNHYDETDERGMYFGSITTTDMLYRYVEMTARGVQTGLFSYLAHPDLFMRRWKNGCKDDFRKAARDLCAVCREEGIPMEYNMHQRYEYGLPELAGYPSRAFFEIVQEEGIPVVTGLDAHVPKELSDPTLWNAAEQEMRAVGIERTQWLNLRSFGKNTESGH